MPPKSPARKVPPRPAGRPVPRRGRPVGDRDAKRMRLLESAMSVIAEEGYGAASLRRVAEHAGCTTGAVTYYFAGKDEMVTAVAERLFDEFDSGLPDQETVDVRSILDTWADRTKSYDSRRWLVLFQLVAHARHEHAFAAVVERRYAGFRNAFTAILARAQRQGTVRDDIGADLLADQLSAMSDGWLMMYPIEPERFTPKRVKALLDAVETLIAPPVTGGSKRATR